MRPVWREMVSFAASLIVVCVAIEVFSWYVWDHRHLNAGGAIGAAIAIYGSRVAKQREDWIKEGKRQMALEVREVLTKMRQPVATIRRLLGEEGNEDL